MFSFRRALRRARSPCERPERPAGSGLALVLVSTRPATVGTGCLRHGCGGPTQGRTDLLDVHFDDRPLVTVLGLPGALLQLADDDDASSLGQGLGHVLAHVSPAGTAEEARLFLPFALALIPLVDGEPNLGHRNTAGGESQLGIFNEVADQGHTVHIAHVLSSLFPYSPPS